MLELLLVGDQPGLAERGCHGVGVPRGGAERAPLGEPGHEAAQRPDPGVQQDLIEARVQPVLRSLRQDRCLGNRMGGDPAFGQRGVRMGWLGLAFFRNGDRCGQFGQAATAHRNSRDHRHTQRRFERGGVDHQPVARELRLALGVGEAPLHGGLRCPGAVFPRPPFPTDRGCP